MNFMASRTSVGTPKRILFVVVTFVIVLNLLEIGLRLMQFRYVPFIDVPSFWGRFYSGEPDGGTFYNEDPVLFWRLKTNLYNDGNPATIEDLSTGPHGFRGENYDFKVKKAADAFRIVCVGDSSTYGDSVRDNQTFSAMLQQRLRKRFPDRTVEVVNAGVPGYTSHQARRYVEYELLKLSPDVIVVMVGANDYIPASGKIADKDRPQVSVTVAQLRKMFGRLRTYQLLAAVVNPLREVMYDTEIELDSEGHELVPMRVGRKDFVKNLKTIATMDDRHRCRTVLMTVPHIFDEEHPLNEDTRRAAKESDAELLDLAKRMKEIQGQGTDLYQPDGGHPSVRGHAEIATMLEEKIAGMMR